jgi:Ring finger domain
MTDYDIDAGLDVQDMVADHTYELCDALTGMEVHRMDANVRPEIMILAYDHVLETIMELYHDIQDDRREYNSQIRLRRHQERLAAQRQRSQQARAMNTVDLTVSVPAPPPRVQPIDRMFPVSGLTKLKSKALKKSELEAQMPDNCGICLEVNTRSNSILTDCGHGFCKTCFDQYIESIRVKPRQERQLKCPMCRKFGPKCTEFRPRKAPVRKPRPQEPVTNEEVDELATLLTGIAV